MTSRDFVYWLQGFAEISGAAPNGQQWIVIRNHLNLVFKHEIDPSMPDPDGKLQAAHDGVPTSAAVDYPAKPSATDLNSTTNYVHLPEAFYEGMIKELDELRADKVRLKKLLEEKDERIEELRNKLQDATGLRPRC